MQIFPFLTFILFIIGILIYLFTLFLINGKIFNLYSHSDFDDKYNEYKEFWRDMTSVQRLVLSETYYQFYINLTQKLDEINENNLNNNKRNIEINITNINYNFTRKVSKYLYVPSILVSLIPKGQKNENEKKLLICSHFDGHNLTEGGTAYDNAINVVSMLGTIDALISKNKKLKTQVDFLFDGSEEYGLMGAYHLVDYLNSKSDDNSKKTEYDYLNLESMGAEPPYGFVIKSDNGNYRIQKALSKTRGSILLASNYIYATKFTSSFTDHEVFDDEGWKGGVSVFLGKGSVYHTKYDRINKEEHLKIAGNQLFNFVLNYNNNGYNGNSFGYGIAPICVVLPSLVIYIITPIIFILSIMSIICKERSNKKLFFKDLLKQLLIFIIVLCIFLVQGILVYLINSNSPSANQVFTILSAISGFFLFLFFHYIFKIEKWSRFRLISDSLIMIISITTDLSLPFSALTILSLLFYLIDNKIFKFICGIIQILVMSLFFAFLIQIFMQYTTRFSEFIGNLVLFCLFFILSYHISVSPLEFYTVIEEKNIYQLIEDVFKDNFGNSDEDKRYLNDDVDYNINDEIGRNTIQPKNNRFCNKKMIPFYLMIIYIVFPIILLLILFFKPDPYSKDYTIRGRFFHLIRNNNDSSMIFITENGYKYAKKNIKKSQFSNFKEEKITKYLDIGISGKAFIYDTNDTKIKSYDKICNDQMPELDFTEIIIPTNNSDGTFDFTFNFNLPNTSCINAIYLYIHCNKCITKINGNPYKKDENEYYNSIIRVGKENINDDYLPDFVIDTNFTLKNYNFNYTVLLNTMKNTESYQDFLNSFGEAVCNARSSIISDTIFKYEGHFPKNN